MVAVRIANNKTLQNTKVRIVPRSVEVVLDFSADPNVGNVVTGHGGQVGFCLSPKKNMSGPSNCKIGKIGVYVQDDWYYGDNEDNPVSYEWAIWINGVDTGFTVVAGGVEGGIETRGYLEDVLGNASDGRIHCEYHNGVFMHNTTSDQILVKMVPNKSITLANLESTTISEYNQEQYDFYTNNPGNLIEGDAAQWSQYFDSKTGEVTICLSPAEAPAEPAGFTAELSKLTAQQIDFNLSWTGPYLEAFTGEVELELYDMGNGLVTSTLFNNSDGWLDHVYLELGENVITGNSYELKITAYGTKPNTDANHYENFTAVEYPRPLRFIANADLEGSASITFGTIARFGGSPNGVQIDWGDGSTETLGQGDLSHEYTTRTEGGYECVITGNADCVLTLTGGALVEVLDYGSIGVRGINHTGAYNLVGVPKEIPTTITTMTFDTDHAMIAQCAKFNDPNISEWELPTAVTDLSFFLSACDEFNQPLGLDTKNVTRLDSVLRNCPKFNQPLAHMDVSNIVSMSSFLAGSEKFGNDLSTWCVPKLNAEPDNFGVGSLLTPELKPGWGTCPFIPTKVDSFSVNWNQRYGVFVAEGTVKNLPEDFADYNVDYEVTTPSGVTYKSTIRFFNDYKFARNFHAINEAGTYTFKVRSKFGGKWTVVAIDIMEGNLDFTPPTVTPNGEAGEYVLTSNNVEAAARGVYNVYRSRSPISLADDFENDSGKYVYDNVHTSDPRVYRIPSEARNGKWYILVGHVGLPDSAVWTYTMTTYG